MGGTASAGGCVDSEDKPGGFARSVYDSRCPAACDKDEEPSVESSPFDLDAQQVFSRAGARAASAAMHGEDLHELRGGPPSETPVRGIQEAARPRADPVDASMEALFSQIPSQWRLRQLDADQLEKLRRLQAQVRDQLRQQRAVVAALQSLPEVEDGSPSGASDTPGATPDVFASSMALGDEEPASPMTLGDNQDQELGEEEECARRPTSQRASALLGTLAENQEATAKSQLLRESLPAALLNGDAAAGAPSQAARPASSAGEADRPRPLFSESSDLLPPTLRRQVQEQLSNILCHLDEPLLPASDQYKGQEPPGEDERFYIENALARIFGFPDASELLRIVDAFRQWRMPASVGIFNQAEPISTGPGLCVLFEGVVDVLHRPNALKPLERVCTYDRRGQVFGELELVYNAPRGSGAGRKTHWATVATRTKVTLWAVDRKLLRDVVPGACPQEG